MSKIRKVVREELRKMFSEQDDVAGIRRKKSSIIAAVAEWESGRLDKVYRWMRNTDDIRPDEDVIIEAQNELQKTIQNLQKALKESRKDSDIDSVSFD